MLGNRSFIRKKRILKKERRLLRPALTSKAGRNCRMRLRNHVAQDQMIHEHVRVLGCACCNEPGSAGRIAGIIDQQQCSVLWVLPQSLCQNEAAFLDGAVVIVA